MTEITNFRGETTSSQVGGIDAAIKGVIERAGVRVREVRKRKGITREALSLKSGVSPRYLAKLEAGTSNISIGLLQRVAVALDHRIEWFIAEDDPWTSDVIRVAELFRSADITVRENVLDCLIPRQTSSPRAQRICLVGLRGAGKSTLGYLASQALGIPFVELNRDIEEQSGMVVPEVMALYGQEGYRKLEAQAVTRVIATHETVILAVAGGVVADPETYNTLLENFHTIWLKTTAEEHMERVRAQGDERPMQGNEAAMQQLRSILTSREALYEKAEVQLDTVNKSSKQSLGELLQLIKAQRFLSEVNCSVHQAG